MQVSESEKLPDLHILQVGKHYIFFLLHGPRKTNVNFLTSPAHRRGLSHLSTDGDGEDG